MPKHSVLGLTALTGLLSLAAPGRADVFIRVPFVTVQVGGRPATVIVSPPAIPPIIIGQSQDVPFVLPQPRSVVETPATIRTVIVAGNRAPTLDEFAASFKPAPGKYEVTILHPVTCEPVRVCFCLPEGCLKKVKVHAREIDFDYDRTEVSIRFVRNGQVRVKD